LKQQELSNRIELYFAANIETWPVKHETLITATENSFKSPLCLNYLRL